MFQNIGLGGIFTFDASQGVTAMGQARDELGRFTRQAQGMPGIFGTVERSVNATFASIKASIGKVRTGMADLGKAAQGAAIASVPLTVGLGLGFKQAANFEAQMATVNAISGATSEDFERLKETAKKFGIETTFSATEAGQAMEFLARSGATAQEIIGGGLKGVIMAAAAEGINLATSADIIAQVVRGQGKTMGDAAHIADVLALTSARTNTSIVALGESFKYGGIQGKAMGFDMHDLAATFGVLADAGLRGSLGGTALSSALTRLTRPTRMNKEILEQLNISLTDTEGKMRPLPDILEDFTKKIGGIKNDATRAGVAARVFGIEGARAFNALASQGTEKLRTLSAELRKSSEGLGAAGEMAKKRLDSWEGFLILFKSAAEGTFIELFEPLLKPMAAAVGDLTTNLSSVLTVVQRLKRGADISEFSDTIQSIGKGFYDAIQSMKSGWAWLVAQIKTASDWLGNRLGGDGLRAMTKFGILAAIVAGALGPVLLALGAISFVITGVIIPALTGIGTLIAAAFSPGILVIAAIAGAVAFLWDGTIKPFLSGLWATVGPGLSLLKDKFMELWVVIQFAFDELLGGVGDLGFSWKSVGEFIGAVLFTVLATAVDIVKFIVLAFVGAGKFIAFAFHPVTLAIQNISRAFGTMFGGEIITGLARLGVAIIDFMLFPLQQIIRTILVLADQIPGASKLIPASVRTFAEEGLTGIIWPEGMEPKTQAAAVTQAKTVQKQKAANPQLNATVENKQEINVKTEVKMDGETILTATGKHKQELQERSGFKATPWQRRMMLEQGAAPVRGAGAGG